MTFGGVLVTLLAISAEPAGASPDDRERLARALFERDASFKSWTITVEWETTVTRAYAEAYARDTGLKGGWQAAEANFSRRGTDTFTEQEPNLFRLDRTMMTLDGKPAGKRVVSRDMTTDWIVREPPREPLLPTAVTINDNAQREYLSYCLWRRMLGWGQDRTRGGNALKSSVREAEVFPPDQSGVPGCWKVVLEDRGDTTSIRTTYLLDEAKRWCVRQILVELLRHDGRPPILGATWTTTEFAKLPGHDFWYPAAFAKQSSTEAVGPTFLYTHRITRFEVHAPRPVTSFTPKLEDGANVHNALTGAVSVSGGGPSRRIVEAVEKQTADTKKLMESLTPEADRPTALGVWDLGAVALAVLGVVCLALAFWRKKA